MPVVTEAKRAVVWNPREDRVIHTVWLGVFWLGMLAGFGTNLPSFMRRQPPWPQIVYWHAAVYVIWLLILTAQVTLVMKNKVALHRRLGKLAVGWAVLMVLLGPSTAFAVMEGYNGHFLHPQFFAVQLMDIVGFAVMFAWAIAMRRNPAVHKRLILTSMIAIADPGFARFSGFALHSLGWKLPASFPLGLWFPFFWFYFYGNVLLVLLMLGWDLLRYRRTVWQFAVGAGAVLASDVCASVMFYDPSWKMTATHWVAEWVRLTH